MESTRDETQAERMDRNWNELLQELRVAQTGVQLLAGFLISMPFQNRFERLTENQQDLYAFTLVSSLVAVCLLLAPVPVHRALFRAGVKREVVRWGHRLAEGGMFFLALSLTLSGALICWAVFGITAGVLSGAGTGALLMGFWVVLPLALRRRGDTG